MREVRWVRAARKVFDTFPERVRGEAATALTIAAAGRKADIAKPLKGFDDAVWELALRHRGDAFRVVYVVRIGDELWVLHCFQKKSTSGIATPRHEIDLVHERLRRLKEGFR